MALHPNFPNDPHVILDSGIRWFPADEAYREKRADQLMPPLVSALRKKVKEWCDDINQVQQAVRYSFVFVDEEGYKKYQPKSFAVLVKSFPEYKV